MWHYVSDCYSDSVMFAHSRSSEQSVPFNLNDGSIQVFALVFGTGSCESISSSKACGQHVVGAGEKVHT